MPRSSARSARSAASGALIGKGNYRHFMQKEIFEQPAVIGDTLQRADQPGDPHGASARTAVRLGELDRGDDDRLRHRLPRLHRREILARADRPHLGRDRHRLGVPLPRRRRCRAGGAAIFVSQSGETADTLAALRYAKAQAQKIIAVVNQPESSIAREADVVLPTLAGPEIGVASTKAFTTQLAVLAASPWRWRGRAARSATTARRSSSAS